MEPVSMIVAALVSGALAKAGEVAGNVLTDAYAGLKKVIEDRYSQSRQVTDVLEANPTSEALQAAAAAALEQERAGHDAELIDKAQRVTEALAGAPAERLQAVGLDLENIKAANLRLKSLTVAGGTGVRLKGGELGDIEIGDVKVGNDRPN